jgi:hypothetical protein
MDYVRGYAWMSLAADAGDGDAIQNRAQLVTLMSGAQRSRASKLAAEYAIRFRTKQ